MERLIVSQKAKLIELTNEYALLDPSGTQVGVVRQEQSAAKKLLRAVTRLDDRMTTTLGVHDATGKILEITRPRTMWRSSFEVSTGPGQLCGRIKQENVFGSVRFGLEDGAGRPIGELRAKDPRGWEFTVFDTADRPMARVTKEWSGIGRELFTSADTYAIDIDPACGYPLRYLCLAAGVGVDTALRQGIGFGL
jgi:uncharacterized protein YxjI